MDNILEIEVGAPAQLDQMVSGGHGSDLGGLDFGLGDGLFTAIDSSEEVDQRLDRAHGGVGPIAVNQLSREASRHPCTVSDGFPASGANGAKPLNEGGKDGAHAPILSHTREIVNPCMGSPDERMSAVTYLPMAVISKPPTYGIAAGSAREVLATNLCALMAASKTLSTFTAVEKATEEKGLKVGKSTIERMCKGKTPVNLDNLEAVAQAFDLDPWQLLVPGLEPKTPPTLRSVSASEESMYARLREVASEIAKLPPK